ncbi:hypothetical protein [Martelella mangrovi]|uniref:Uncharacterized protein n=1 Tax=Martelella mangrovi TaxID=1397477 RepID=A0ABV2IB01_9HYPH
MAKRSFESAASPRSTWRRENLPDPKKIAERGIRTKESLEWLAAQKPKLPALEHPAPSEALRAAAKRESDAAHKAVIDALRQNWRERARKGRQDFETARGRRARDATQER